MKWVLQTELPTGSPGAGPAFASPRVRRLRFVWTFLGNPPKLSLPRRNLRRSTAQYSTAACSCADSAQFAHFLHFVGVGGFLFPERR